MSQRESNKEWNDSLVHQYVQQAKRQRKEQSLFSVEVFLSPTSRLTHGCSNLIVKTIKRVFFY